MEKAMIRLHASLIQVSIGTLLAAVISLPAAGDPVTGRETSASDQRARSVNSGNAPEFKMTYRSLYNARLERRKRAEMAAMEVPANKRTQKSGGEKGFQGE
jgi:hypothetical protein